MSKLLIISLILKYSSIMGVDSRVALAVAETESKMNPNAIGQLGEVGIYQVRPQYSVFSKKELLDPETNILEGIRMLKEAKRHCIHQQGITYLICYNTGIRAAKKIKHPHKFPYILAVKKQMMLTKLEGL